MSDEALRVGVLAIEPIDIDQQAFAATVDFPHFREQGAQRFSLLADCTRKWCPPLPPPMQADLIGRGHHADLASEVGRSPGKERAA